MSTEAWIGLVFSLIVAPVVVWRLTKFLETKKPRLLVHKAYFTNNYNKWYYFCKVQNRSTKDITITHWWLIDEGEEIYYTMADSRFGTYNPLQTKLAPWDEWEGQFDVDIIQDKENIFKNVRVKLSNDKRIKSRHNKGVPQKGTVGGINLKGADTGSMPRST